MLHVLPPVLRAPLLAALCFTVLLFGSGAARAQSLAACGNIHVEANAQCEAVVTGGCVARCEELKFEASCHARGYARCEGRCDADISVDCTGSCDIATCRAKCDVNPPQFQCEANCVAGCDLECAGTCEGECGTDTACRSRCQGSCKATCQGECSGGCTGTPGSANCEAKCEASCRGQCAGRARVECQVGCQSDFQAGCETELEGGCKVKCTEPEGVVECNGEYVDHGGNAEECLDAIEAWAASINVSASGSATAACDNGVCTAQAEGEASCECSAPGGNASDSPLFSGASALIGIGALAFGTFLRRRRAQEGR
ncbi:MAG TPA: hypothetical protein VK524_04905 [Polyangiaceae bacterium]|nr:hypothetical protein [Polyangiaceae bacterium]